MTLSKSIQLKAFSGFDWPTSLKLVDLPLAGVSSLTTLPFHRSQRNKSLYLSPRLKSNIVNL